MENMRIGIDCHNLEGQRTGVGRYLANLLRVWKLETRAEFFLYFKNKIPQDTYGGLHEYTHDREDIIEVGANFRILRTKSNALFKHWLLPRAAAKDKIDVLFCPDYVLPIYLPRRIKTAVTIHDIIYEARPEEYSWPSRADRILLKWASKQSAKNADIIFAPSEFTKSEILKYYKVNPEKIIVTPLAPDPIFRQPTQPHPAPSPLRRGRVGVWVGGVPMNDKSGESSKTKFQQNGKYILFVGSLFNRRFLPQKIQGFAMFAKDHPEFIFLIIGKNYTKPFQDISALSKKANQQLGREAIIWREYAADEELVYLYNGAFVMLWLSSYEGFGLPILESMACGTPVVTCRAGSLPEVAGDAAVYIAHPENPEEISGALFELASNTALYGNLSVRCLAHAQNFSWKSCTQLTLNSMLKLG